MRHLVALTISLVALFVCGGAYKISICEGRQGWAKCRREYVINVKEGFYGRKNKKTCPTPPILTTSCSAATSFNKLKSTCDGKNSCRVSANNRVFGDPCYGTVKYVEMTYLCQYLHQRTFCEHKPSGHITCPSGLVISLVSGFYGRKSASVCPTAPILTTSCSAATSFNKLKSICDGKNSCQVSASNRVFGDPCYGTVKYVQMNYYCKVH